MAQVKLNSVGATKSLTVWLNFGKSCFACSKPLTFTEMQIDHIEPRQYAIDNDLAIDNSLYNLSSLCKSCNSAKGNVLPHDFYTVEQLQVLELCTTKVWTKEQLFSEGDALAISMPNSKFARLYRDGKFHVYA